MVKFITNMPKPALCQVLCEATVGKMHGIAAASSSAISVCLDTHVFFVSLIFIMHDKKCALVGPYSCSIQCCHVISEDAARLSVHVACS